MGAKLVGQVLAEWAPHLPPHLTLALVQLAHTARDDDDPPRYYAGIRPIARALGPRPNAADPDNAAEQAALPRLAEAAALRFTVTRLHDRIFHDPSKLVTPKDPAVFLRRLDGWRALEAVA